MRAYETAEDRAGTLQGDVDLLLKRAIANATARLAEWQLQFSIEPGKALVWSPPAFEAAAEISQATYLMQSMYFYDALPAELAAQPLRMAEYEPVLAADPTALARALMSVCSRLVCQRLQQQIGELVARHRSRPD